MAWTSTTCANFASLSASNVLTYYLPHCPNMVMPTLQILNCMHLKRWIIIYWEYIVNVLTQIDFFQDVRSVLTSVVGQRKFTHASSPVRGLPMFVLRQQLDGSILSVKRNPPGFIPPHFRQTVSSVLKSCLL